MNVKVELSNDCPHSWIPARPQIKRWLDAACESIGGATTKATVSVKIVTEQNSSALNKQYRGKDYPTNVLSFSSELPANVIALLDYAPLGDIAICPAVVEREALQQNKQLDAHWAHMLTHGFLHLHGYDHEDDGSAAEMEALEINLLNKLGFPNPYSTNQ